MRYLVALGVSHRSANILSELVAVGTRLLPALGHRQLFTLVHSHWAAGLTGQLGTHGILHQFADLVRNAPALRVGLLLASHHGHILALLLHQISADRTWDLLADRVGHHRTDFVGQGNAVSVRFLPASLHGQRLALLFRHQFADLVVSALLDWNKLAHSLRSLLRLGELGAGNLMALFNFFNPALMLSPALLHVLVVADLLFSQHADFRILGRALLGGLIVAHLALDILALLRGLRGALVSS